MDALGQTVIRACAVAVMICAVLFADGKTMDRPQAIARFLIAALLIPLLQLIPLPPGLWQSLPGHDVLSAAIGGPQPWRPWSLQPDATLNAALSLTVPIATLVVLCLISDRERRLVMSMLLALITLSAAIASTQVAGSAADNPFINEMRGEVSGFFANRNHLALLLAIGCLVAPVWALVDRPVVTWRVPLALALLILFVLLILASGSRAGAVFGVVGTVAGLAIARGDWQRVAGARQRWMAFPALAAMMVLTGLLIWASASADHATALHRAATMTLTDDARTQALPTVLELVRRYLPLGSGFGTFDTAFRMDEPFGLLTLTYLNHAHDDVLEIVLEGGVVALALFVAAIGWWLVASLRVWRRARTPAVVRGRVGSLVILLVLTASLFDYPARTPVIMAVLVIAAMWLRWGSIRPATTSLPSRAATL